MKLKALKSFGGKISMYAGEVREVTDEFIVKDLLRAGYAEPYAQEAVVVSKKENATPKKPVQETTRKNTRKKK